jgi:transketolase
MSDKVKKKIAPTLVTTTTNANATASANKAFEAAAQKKNPLENAADLIAMRYGISGEAPHINEEVFKQNRALGKKVVPLKEYFEQTAKAFAQKEAEKKEETTQKKREYAKLTPCQRKMNTLQRNIDGYVKGCDRTMSNEALIEMANKARAKVAESNATTTTKTTTKTKRKPKGSRNSRNSRNSRKSRNSRTSNTPKKGGRTRRTK